MPWLGKFWDGRELKSGRKWLLLCFYGYQKISWPRTKKGRKMATFEQFDQLKIFSKTGYCNGNAAFDIFVIECEALNVKLENRK